MFADIYRNRRVLVTGHTGFKGSWLALWLHTLGAEVIGVSLPPETKPNHWDLLKLNIKEYYTDIRDAKKLSKVVAKAKPEIVFHLAAQSLVRRSYRQPQETWDTNVMGTVNVLEACRGADSVKAILVVTTDKCYENMESRIGYKETDRLGGHDPYSASKAAVELAVASYRDALLKNAPLIATARAGNVIGGGDWAEDRLIPDLMRAQEKGEVLIIRSSNAMRPWQHVLEPLSGYLQLGQGLLEGKQEYQGPWNFGPGDDDAMSVTEVLTRMKASFRPERDMSLHETVMLRLDSSKARSKLRWQPILNMQEQLAITADWYNAYHKDKKIISHEQLQAYQNAAKAKAAWA